MSANIVLQHFLAQGAAAQAQSLRGFGLIVPGMLQDRLEQRLFHFIHEHDMQTAGIMAIHLRKIVLDSPSYLCG